MNHECDSRCSCRVDLDAAAAALEEASRLLSDSIMISSDDVIEACYARLRANWAKFRGAMEVYREHLAETEPQEFLGQRVSLG
jgi:hypothetical protein